MGRSKVFTLSCLWLLYRDTGSVEIVKMNRSTVSTALERALHLESFVEHWAGGLEVLSVLKVTIQCLDRCSSVDTQGFESFAIVDEAIMPDFVAEPLISVPRGRSQVLERTDYEATQFATFLGHG